MNYKTYACPPSRGARMVRRERLDESASRPYSAGMTKLLEEAIDAVRRLPPEMQDDLGRFLLELTSQAPLTPDEIAALDEAEAEIARGEGISGKELRAFWRSLGI